VAQPGGLTSGFAVHLVLACIVSGVVVRVVGRERERERGGENAMCGRGTRVGMTSVNEHDDTSLSSRRPLHGRAGRPTTTTAGTSWNSCLRPEVGRSGEENRCASIDRGRRTVQCIAGILT